MTKKVAIIGTAGLPANYGGFETLCEYLTLHLGESYDLTVFCSRKNYRQKLASYNNASLVYLPFNANGVQSVVYDIVAVFKALGFADTLLVLGVSGCVVLPLVKLVSSRKLVVNIDGLEWKRDKWNRLAKWFLKFSEKLAVRYADEVITDNRAIQSYVQAEYGRQSSLIAYGADHVQPVALAAETKEKYPLAAGSYAFTVCRIEPENNIDLILETFARTDYPFIMVGNWQNSQYGRDLVVKYAACRTMLLCGPIYDPSELNQLRGNASLYIHGHSAGGTNPSLVEAMCLGLPICAFDVDYNRETTENRARYFRNSTELLALIEAHRQAGSGQVGAAMQEIAGRRYRWQKIVADYEGLL